MKMPAKTILIAFLSFTIASCKSKNKYKFPFLDPGLHIEKRADDLVGRMTPDEKNGQMMNAAPTIDRPGVKVILPGKFEIEVGGGQPDVKVKTNSNILKTMITLL